MWPTSKPNFTAVIQNIGQVIKGKEDVVSKVLVTLISGGHVLLFDVPGTGSHAGQNHCGVDTVSTFLDPVHAGSPPNGHYWLEHFQHAFQGIRVSARGPSLPIFYLLMRSTVPLPRRSQHFLRSWQSDKSPLKEKHIVLPPHS